MTDWMAHGTPLHEILDSEARTCYNRFMVNGKAGKYEGPDELSHVYAFARTEERAAEIALTANTLGVTRKGKFVAGSFKVAEIPDRLPAVIGTLTGN